MATQSQLQEVIKQNNYTNIALYHNNGNKGKGVNILDIDSGDHGAGTEMRVHDSAPEANIYLLTMDSYTDSDGMHTSIEYNGQTYTLEEIIQLLNIKIITRSLGGGSAENITQSIFYNNLKNKYNLIFNHAAGNEDVGGSIPHDVAMWWTQVNFDRYGKPIKAPLIANGEQIDFATFAGYLNGTSFCSPYGAGMEALIINKYSNYGLNMSHNEMFAYLKLICKDLYEAGHDIKTGFGMPILPLLDKKYITMQTTSNTYYVDGVAKTMDCVPKNINGNVFCPVRVLAEEFGYTIKTSFNQDKTIHIVMTNGSNEIIMNTNSEIAYINKKEVIIKNTKGDIVKPFIDENNRTLVPVRFLSESMNLNISWVQNENRVVILER